MVNLSSNDLVTTLPCAGNCETLPSWTFSTAPDLKIRITFSQFRFVDGNWYLEIGDGKIIRKATKLAHFTGYDLPKDVTSDISDWIYVSFLTHTVRNYINHILHHSFFIKTKQQLLFHPIDVTLRDTETLRLSSSNNSYVYWSVHAPANSAVSVNFEQSDILSLWDKFTYLKVVDTKEDALETSNFASWTNLISPDGTFYSAYFNFTSRSSYLALIFSSTKTKCAFTITFRAIDPGGNRGERVEFALGASPPTTWFSPLLWLDISFADDVMTTYP